MKLEQKEILRKKRVLEYAETCGNVLKTCRHFGVSRSNLDTSGNGLILMGG
jgi:hypothetical protein